ncbi:hypothetical protein AAVH_40658 [Aphelenchoides avenae]|nr:hypothetical protein AAVH_40658 [Aphelenchus avenae]
MKSPNVDLEAEARIRKRTLVSFRTFAAGVPRGPGYVNGTKGLIDPLDTDPNKDYTPNWVVACVVAAPTGLLLY